MAMIVGKFVTLLIPYTFKWATNALAGQGDVPTLSELVILTPALLVGAYGMARFVSHAFNQIRDALFAAVGQHAVRSLSNRTFRHLHNLSLRFHLQRRTGGLSRVIERGKMGIETIIRLTMMIAIPTLIEFVLTAVILWLQFDIGYVLVVSATVIIYVWFSVWSSNRRIKIRKDMNEADSDSMSKAVEFIVEF